VGGTGGDRTMSTITKPHEGDDDGDDDDGHAL
jgi:hypothetical protein